MPFSIKKLLQEYLAERPSRGGMLPVCTSLLIVLLHQRSKVVLILQTNVGQRLPLCGDYTNIAVQGQWQYQELTHPQDLRTFTAELSHRLTRALMAGVDLPATR